MIFSPYEITVDASWIMSWHSLIPTYNPIETSEVFCKQLGLDDRLLPYQALVNLALCMIVECYSESCLYHLGIRDAEYELPAYPGDTLRSVMIIEGIRNTSSGKYSVIDSKVVLLNQRNERVLSMERSSLFPAFETEGNAKPLTDHPIYRKILSGYPDIRLRNTILNHAVTMKKDLLTYQEAFEKDQLVLHSLVRPVGLSSSILYTNLCKNTHPVHFNNARYGVDDLVVSGGFVLPVVLGATTRDFKHALHQTLLDTMHINKVRHDDSVGAISYILDRKIKGGGLEELTIRTFGVKNIDVERELEDVEIPYEMLLLDELKPSELELICRDHCPKLHKKICVRATWKMWRKKTV